MKALLVRPQFPTPDSKPYPPFSLLTLAPYIKGDVQLCDLQANGDFERTLSVFNPDCVLFSAFSSQLTETNRLCSLLPENSVSIVGGSGVTSSVDYASRILSDADYIVAGDGEELMLKLSDLRKAQKTTVIRTHRFNWVDYKIPKWDLVQNKKYPYAIETSRGCPNNCFWCTAHTIHSRCWRPRNPYSIIQEIKFLNQAYGARHFYFTDDNATVDPARWRVLLEKIVDLRLKLRIDVPEGIEAKNLDYYTLSLMKKAGINFFYIGAESGCQRVLDKVIDKAGLRVDQVVQAVKDAVKLKMKVNCFFVIGAVGETLEEAELTVEFAQYLRELGAWSCSVRNAIPIHGTRMFEVAKANGYLTVPEDKLYDYQFIHQQRHFLRTPEWEPEQIEALVKKAAAQDAQHMLGHTRYLIRRGVAKLFSNPRATINRFNQLVGTAKS